MQTFVHRGKNSFRPAALLTSILATGLPVSSWADTFTVVNLDDGGPGSLREAILDANANPGPDEIRFAHGLRGTIALTSGELTVTDDLRIDGPGVNRLTVSGNDTSRVFNVSGKGIAVEIRRLTIAHGLATGATAEGPYGPVTLGGGLLNWGARLTLAHVAVLNNHASGGTENTGSGGGIASVFGATLAVIHGTFTGNRATGTRGIGGGILNDYGSVLSVEHAVFTHNQASATMAGSPTMDPSLPGSGQGGAIGSFGGSHSTVSHCDLAGNLAQGGNGADGGPGENGGVGGTGVGGAIRSTNRSWLVSDAGGASLVVAHSSFTNNRAISGNGGNGGDGANGGAGRNGSGGAIASVSENEGQDSTTTIRHSWFIGNRAIGGRSGNGGAGGSGGSAFVITQAGAIQTAEAVVIEESVFVDNQAIGSSGGDGGTGGNGGHGIRAAGGAISVVTAIGHNQSLAMARNIVQHNQAVGGTGGSGVVGGNGGPGHGGGIRLELLGTGCVGQSRVTNNSAIGGLGGAGGQDGEGVGGGIWIQLATVGLVETEVMDNFASTSDPDVSGDFIRECEF